ncbi:MAG: conjugal transfer protein [Streptosporangiaceae bacterium]
MVRRALLERSDQLTADDDEALPPLGPESARAGHTAAPWRGSGGRWLVWVARAVAWAVLLLIGYRGVLAIVEGTGTTPPAATPASAPPSAGSQFPVTAAEAYALEFGDVYLNFSPSTAAARSRDLASFVAPGADSQLGWNGAGSQHVFDEQVSAIRVTGAHTAVVTLLARVSGGRLIELGVPVYAAGGGLTVSRNPALLPGPARAVQPAASQQTSDQATETELQGQLPAFFAAYGSGDEATLARFAAPGAHISGLGGGVTFSAIDSVYAPAGGSTRQISVTVTWQLAAGAGTSADVSGAPAELQMTYQLTIVRQDGSWDVQSIGAATQAQPQGSP